MVQNNSETDLNMKNDLADGNTPPKKGLSLAAQIFIALVLGIIAGLALVSHPLIATTYIKPFGTIFLKLIKWVVGPLVFFSIMSGIIAMKDKIGRAHV